MGHDARGEAVVLVHCARLLVAKSFHFSNFEYSRATEHHQIQQLCSDYSLMDNESVFQF